MTGGVPNRSFLQNPSFTGEMDGYQGKAQRFVDWNAANNTHIAEDERMATLYANSMIHEIFTFGPLGYRTDQLGQTTQLTSPNLNNSELIMFTEQERTRALAALRP